MTTKPNNETKRELRFPYKRYIVKWRCLETGRQGILADSYGHTMAMEIAAHCNQLDPCFVHTYEEAPCPTEDENRWAKSQWAKQAIEFVVKKLDEKEREVPDAKD